MTTLDEDRETKLPFWARDKLNALRVEVIGLRHELATVQATHELLTKHHWFTIPGPDFERGEDVRRIWYLNRNDPLQVCALGPGDVLLVGRHREENIS